MNPNEAEWRRAKCRGPDGTVVLWRIGEMRAAYWSDALPVSVATGLYAQDVMLAGRATRMCGIPDSVWPAALDMMVSAGLNVVVK